MGTPYDKLDISYYATYVYNGIPYIPHYTREDCYIPPGYTVNTGMTDNNGNRFFVVDRTKEMTARELDTAGAKKVATYLWRRPKYKELT